MDNELTSPFALLGSAWRMAFSRRMIGLYLLLGAIPQVISLIGGFLYSANAGSLTLSIQKLFTNSNGIGSAALIVGGFILLLVIGIMSIWYAAVLYHIYRDTTTSSLAPLRTYLRPAWNKTMHLWTTYFMVGLTTFIGLLLLVIPGIIFAYWYMFAPLIAVLEDRAINPMKESKRLVKGRFWKLVGRSIIMITAYNIPAIILQALHPTLGMVWSITSPIFGLYYFLIYQDFKRTAVAAV